MFKFEATTSVWMMHKYFCIELEKSFISIALLWNWWEHKNDYRYSLSTPKWLYQTLKNYITPTILWYRIFKI